MNSVLTVNKEFVNLLVKCKCIIFDQHQVLRSQNQVSPDFAAAVQEIVKEINWFMLNYTSAANNNNVTLQTNTNQSTMKKVSPKSTAEILALEHYELEATNIHSITVPPLTSISQAKSRDYITNDLVKPYHCKQCPKKFGSFHRLKQHLLVHTGEKPYECDFCHKTFRRQPTLAAHKKIHTGEKPYECKICRRRFRQHSTYRAHTRVHSGEKPIKCEYCDQRFNNHSGKIAHTRSKHTGEKPFLCELCSASFITASMLKSHIRRHNNDKPYLCTHCPLKFVTNTGLRKHLRVHIVSQCDQWSVPA